MNEQGRDAGVGALIASSWSARAKAARITRRYGTFGYSIEDEFVDSLIRAIANSTQDDVLELRLAAGVLAGRFDRAMEVDRIEADRAKRERSALADADATVEAHLLDVKRRADPNSCSVARRGSSACRAGTTNAKRASRRRSPKSDRA